MVVSPSLRASRPLVLLAAIISTLILLGIGLDTRGHRHAVSHLLPQSWRPDGLQYTDRSVARRLRAVRKRCATRDMFEDMFGRTNLRMTRSYEGSLFRLERFVNKLLRGEPVVVGAVGGSVTRGHGVAEDERWMDQLKELLHEAYPDSNITMVNGAVPASGSDYFSFCFNLHIPPEVDLVFVELGVNDEGVMEHADDMDNLLRGLLQMPNDPAVVLVEIAAFSNGRMAGSGGRMHLSVAQYYDVPVLNQRWPLVSHFARFPELVPHYFVTEWWGWTDLRHLGPKGHYDVSRIIGSLLRDVTCGMVNQRDYAVPPAEEPESVIPFEDKPHNSYNQQLQVLFDGDSRRAKATVDEIQHHWPSDTRQWEHSPSEDDVKNFDIENSTQVAPGLWTAPTELGRLPRLRAMEPWNANVDHITPPFRPQCLSTRATDPKFNLTPVASEGWEWWVLDIIPDKPYLVAEKPGSRVTFELDVNVGVIKLYSLRSATFGFGKVDCWVDDNVKDKVKIDGHWDNADLNIGRFTTLTENAASGKHRITCELLSETNDPDGRTQFRIISVMGV